MTKGQKGITLIALVITIIVMLILVGVSVTVALNGGLFDTAERAADQTENVMDRENKLDSSSVYINGQDEEGVDIENYVNNLRDED